MKIIFVKVLIRVVINFFGCILICTAVHAVSPAVTLLIQSEKLPVAEKRLITIDAKTRRNFESSLQSICKQAGVTIVAEGTPFEPMLTDDDAVKLTKSLPNWINVPISDCLSAIAHSYDYDAHFEKAHLIILTKRYSQEDDLPCVTYDEVVESIRNILSLVREYGSVETPSPHYSNQFYALLSPEQRQLAQTALTSQDMTPDQLQHASDAVTDEYMGGVAHGLKQSLEHLLALKNPETVFKWINFDGYEAFGYRGPVNPYGLTGDCPLDNRFKLLSAGFLRPVEKIQSTSAAAAGVPMIELPDAPHQEDDPTVPRDIDRKLASGMYANAVPSTIAIEALAAQLSNHSSVSTSLDRKEKWSDVKVGVDPKLAGKPISIYGINFSSKDEIVRAVADIYGLQLLVPKVHDYFLTTNSPRKVESPEDFPKQITRLVPAPLIHQFAGLSASFAASAPTFQPTIVNSSNIKTLDEMRMEANNQRIKYLASARATEAGYYPAVRRLIVLAKPYVPTPQSPPVPFRNVGLEVMRLDALMLYSVGCRHAVRELNEKPLPIGIFDPNRLVITVTYPVGPSHPDIRYGYKDDQGVFHADGLFWRMH